MTSLVIFDKGVLPEYTDLQENSWHIIQPNAGTCLDGSDWLFGARTGSKNEQINSEDILIHFMGGGACWTETLMNFGYCATKLAFQADSIDLAYLNSLNGILSEDSQNAFKNYTLVLLPYCSGDLFIGTPHGNDGLNHNGANMTFTVLDWLTDVFPSANNILMSGVSAGGLAVMMYSSVFQSSFSKIPNLTYFSDCAIYPHVDTNTIAEAWGKDKRLSAVHSCFDAEYSGVESFLCLISNKSHTGLFFTYTDDEIQKLFDSIWDSSNDWSCQAAGLLERSVNSSVGNVGYYTRIGTDHGTSQSSEFFIPNAEGVSPHDFVLDAVSRKVCSYKNFTLDFLDSCEYSFSNITGICREESGKSDSDIPKSNLIIYYTLAGVATISLMLCVIRFFYKRSKSEGHRKEGKSTEKSTSEMATEMSFI